MSLPRVLEYGYSKPENSQAGGTLRNLEQFFILQINAYLSTIHFIFEYARTMPGAVTKLSTHALHYGVDSSVRNNYVNMMITQVK